MIFECATQDDGYEPTQRENEGFIANATKPGRMQQESGDDREREEEEDESARMQQESGDDEREREDDESGRMPHESGDARVVEDEEEESGRMPRHNGVDFPEGEGVRDVLVCSTPEQVGCDDEHSSGSEIPEDDCELVCETQCGEHASDGEKSGNKNDEVKNNPVNRFSSLDAFFSSLSVVGTAELVEMCGISGITDVEALFNCLPDDYEQWPSALRLVCDIFAGSCAQRGGSGVAFSGIGRHGVHVAEFYAKMLDYGSKMLGPKRKKKKGKQAKRKDADDDSGETSQAKKKVRVDGAKSLPKKELYRLANGPDGLSVLKDLFSSEHFDVHVIRKKTTFAVGGSTATVDTENLYYFGDAKDVPSSRTGGITLARVGSGRKDKIEYFPGRPIEYVSNVGGETLSGRKHTEPN